MRAAAQNAGGLVGFDLDTFLSLAERTRKWQCPHSMQPGTVQELVEDGFLRHVLASLQVGRPRPRARRRPDSCERPALAHRRQASNPAPRLCSLSHALWDTLTELLRALPRCLGVPSGLPAAVRLSGAETEAYADTVPSVTQYLYPTSHIRYPILCHRPRWRAGCVCCR